MSEVLSERKQLDLHQRVTDEIVRAIEAGAGPFVMPWHGFPQGLPRNVMTGHPYNGVNTLVLWAAARTRRYLTPYWATYRQWRELAAQVRKGEKATTVVFYKQVPLEGEDVETGDVVHDYRLVARAFFVFNGEQVDGWKAPGPEAIDLVQNHDRIEDFALCTGADIRSAGDRAYYDPMGDYITIPNRVRFVGSPTSSATEGYYSTVFHELVHWTGHHRRLGRKLEGRFGSESYAMEELVAEFGAAFLCAEFLVPNKPRPDHAAYIQGWLKVLKADKRAIFAASTAAHQAVDFLRCP
jgi:antirestriction protein ArdC